MAIGLPEIIEGLMIRLDSTIRRREYEEAQLIVKLLLELNKISNIPIS